MTNMELSENKKPRFKNRGIFATPEEQAVQPRPTYFQFLLPHFIKEECNFRHCERVNNVTCCVLYPLGNDIANIGFIHEINNNKFLNNLHHTGYQSVSQSSLFAKFLETKTKMLACFHTEIGNPIPNLLKQINRFSAISPSEFGTKSHSRNPLVFGLFVRIRMVEQVGSGIGRIKDQMKKAKLPVPEFKTEGMFTVVLHRAVEKTVEKTVEKINLSTTAKRIIERIKEHPEITTKELAEYIGITNKGIEYNLSRLQKSDVIYREGSKKSGVWKLKKPRE